MTNWEELAKEKRDSVNSLIPKEWLLSSIPTKEEQRDVTGEYIQQFLTTREVEITETDAVGIVQKTCFGKWKAVEVAKAFCHRAAIAHQLVRVPLPSKCGKLLMSKIRSIAYTRSSSMMPLHTLAPWMSTMRKMGRPSGLSMDYL
jgi:hypothetical protein